MNFLKELFLYLKFRKKYWLVPILVFLILLGVAVIASIGSVAPPFIYTLF